MLMLMKFYLQGINFSFFLMRNIIGIVLLLGLSASQLYSQQEITTYQVDTSMFGGQLKIRMHTFEGPISGFSKIIKELDNSQQEQIRSLSYEEIERRRREEAILLKKEIDSFRVLVFTNEIGLTDDESLVFWPLYNNYLVTQDSIFERRRKAISKINNPYLQISEKEAERLVHAYNYSFVEESELLSKYETKFKEILGPKKHMLLHRAEFRFKKWLLNNL